MTDVYDAIPENDQSLIKSVYKKEGAKGLKDVIMQNKNKWKSQPVKIAVTGNTGSGKSSFINAFRGLSPNDKEAAQVGVTETTNEIISYTCTGNDKFVLFDIPGVGSRNYPKEIYMEEIGFERFEFFIIITSCRFTENDAWLGKMVKKHNKQCIYVRTKVDSDILSEVYDKGEDFNEAVTIEQIREDARKCLFKANVDAPVYLITTRLNMRNTFDLPSLIHAINDLAIVLKRNALRDLLQTLAENVINEKIKRFMIFASAWTTGLPMSLSAVLTDEVFILTRVRACRKELFLDEDSLKGVHDYYAISIDELKLSCREIDPFNYCRPRNVTGNFVLRFLGSAISSEERHYENISILYKIINDLKGDALKISREIIKQMI